MAIPGPAVAVSATGQQLAIGPPGPRGPQGSEGPAGPPGPAGSETAAIVRWAASSGTYTFPSGTDTIVWLDARAGVISIIADSTPVDKQLMALKDSRQIFATNGPGVVTTQAIEYPPGKMNAAGTLGFGSSASPPDPNDQGIYVVWRWGQAEGAWQCVA